MFQVNRCSDGIGSRFHKRGGIGTHDHLLGNSANLQRNVDVRHARRLDSDGLEYCGLKADLGHRQFILSHGETYEAVCTLVLRRGSAYVVCRKILKL